MPQRLIFIFSLAVGASIATHAGAAAIEHQPVGCVVAERFPHFEARFTPPETVARARVFFRSEGGSSWYAVPMTRTGDNFTAYLPKPKKSLPRFSYYVEVVDASMATTRTAEHTASVAANAGACTPDMMVAPGAAAAAILVEAPAGAAAVVPAGFSGTSVTGAVAGGGIGTTTVVVAGAGVAAVGAGAVVAASVVGSESDGDGGNGPGFQVIGVRGTVYGGFGPNPANPNGPGLYAPAVAGAVVSTSLDSTTTQTDGNGHFHLVTQTRATMPCQIFTLTITAAGWPTWTATDHFDNSSSPSEMIFTFIPQRPMTPFGSC